MAERLLWRSTARLESETLTTVASICESNDPRTATQTPFHAAALSRADSEMAVSGKGSQNFFGAAHEAGTREDVCKGEAVVVRILAGAGIFDDDEVEAESGALAYGGLDTDVGGD